MKRFILFTGMIIAVSSFGSLSYAQSPDGLTNNTLLCNGGHVDTQSKVPLVGDKGDCICSIPTVWYNPMECRSKKNPNKITVYVCPAGHPAKLRFWQQDSTGKNAICVSNS